MWVLLQKRFAKDYRTSKVLFSCVPFGGSLLMRPKSALMLLAIFTLPAQAQWQKEIPITNVAKQSDGIRATFQSGAVLRLQVC